MVYLINAVADSLKSMKPLQQIITQPQFYRENFTLDLHYIFTQIRYVDTTRTFNNYLIATLFIW